MEPQLPSPNIGPERAVPSMEHAAPAQAIPEIRTPMERAEQREATEMQPQGPSNQGPVSPATTPPPLPQIQPLTSTAPAAPADDNPMVAGDEELIEKEWVEKAKKVIAETKHDPYLQEQAVSKLQADYLQKRYNKTVKVPSDSA